MRPSDSPGPSASITVAFPTVADEASPPGAGEEQLAAALDEALDAMQAGRPVDRAALLARHPELAGPLDALLRLGCESATTIDGVRPTAPAAPLEKLGPYVVEREIGAGGFGMVYLAYDPGVKRRVALKVLHPGWLSQPEAVLRFQREVYVTARLRHPGIVQLYDYSREGPPHYLVTEFVEAGVDPCTWCREGEANIGATVDLAARIAEAVDHAHAHGVYHRDLKPANILVDRAGNPHVLDFGLARVLTGEESAAPTGEGRILGSLAYMAPEQAAGHSHDADARSDVYSLGVILYQLLTGELPFHGPAHTLPARIMEDDPPPPRQLNKAVPPALEAVCLKALAKLPERRYQSAGALARDLRTYLRGERVEAQEHNWLAFASRLLGRRHKDTRTQGWTLLLTLLGLAILTGCVLVNVWELLLPPGQRWPLVLCTKTVQVVVMLYLAVRFRPLKEPSLTSMERQALTLVPAYYGSFLALAAVNLVLDEPIPLAPILAILSGMGFMTVAPTIWGWFYLWGVTFFVIAVLIAFWPLYGMTLLGVGWFLALGVGALHMRYTR